MPTLFGLTFIILIFMLFSKSRQKNNSQKRADFWKKERESNLIPAKDISSLDYLTVAYDRLPFCYWTPGPEAPVSLQAAPAPPSCNGSENPEELPEMVQESSYTLSSAHIAPLGEEIAEAEYTLCSLSGKRILNLTGISNTELRLTYGTMNLDPLTSYDQNFTVLIRTLQKWGALLVSSGNYDDAVTVLSYAVDIGTDIAGTFTLLGRLYKSKKEFDKIDELRQRAEQLTTLMKPSILRDLEHLLTSESD